MGLAFLIRQIATSSGPLLKVLIMKLLIVLSLCLVAAFAEKCAVSCPKIHRPACGSDLNTYGNTCLMKLASCKAGKAIIPIYNGKCKAEESCQINCPKNYRPVCGSDGVKHHNYCALRVAACQAKQAISIVREPRRNQDCDCDFPCSKISRPVCGSDGTTYANFCTMRQTACKTKTAIIPINKGKCQA